MKGEGGGLAGRNNNKANFFKLSSRGISPEILSGPGYALVGEWISHPVSVSSVGPEGARQPMFRALRYAL